MGRFDTGADRPPTTRRALYPGSFDPFHLGHLDVVEQAHALFGEVVVAVMHNFSKNSGFFDVDERVELIEIAVDHLDGVTVSSHTGLAVQAAVDEDVDFIVKGLRTPGDFEVEQQMAQMNRSVSDVFTVYVPCRPDLGFVSSRFVREISNYGGDVAHLVPPAVADALSDRTDGPERRSETR